MIRRYVVAALFLGIAACVTSVPQSQDSGAKARSSTTDSNSTTAAGEMEVIDIPEVRNVAIVPGQDEVICRLEKRTGTNRATRVCRSRSQNARSAREAKETFEILRRSQTDHQ